MIDKSKKSGEYLIKKLASHNPEGKGLCIGFNEKRSGTDLRCLESGLLISCLAGRIVLFPPLDVSKEEIDKAIDILIKCI